MFSINKVKKYSRVFKCLKVSIIFMMMLLISGINPAYANKQDIISDIRITKLESIIDTTTGQKIMIPVVRLEWDEPNISTEEDNTPGVSDASGLHKAEYYEIYLRNITRQDKDFTKIIETSDTQCELKNELDNGEIYEIKVVPIHKHTIIENEKSTTEFAMSVDREPITKKILTEPEFSVNVEGTKIKVTMDDAGTWMDYKVYYEKQKSTPFEDGLSVDEGVPVDRKGDNVRSFIDNSSGKAKAKLEITIEDDMSIKPGQAYSIAVLAKDVPSDEHFIMTPAKFNVVNCATEVPFSLYEESDDYLKLSWFGLNAGANLKSIAIMTSSSETSLKEFAVLKNDDALNVEYYLIKKPDIKSYYKIIIEYTGSDDVTTTKASSQIISFDPNLKRVIPGRPDLNGHKKEDNILLSWTPFIFENEIDLDVYYDILISDSTYLLTDDKMNLLSDYYVTKGSIEASNVKNDMMYKKEFDKYVTTLLDSNGSVEGYSVKDLEPNKVYYVRVIAKKKVSEGELKSEPAIIAIYVNPEDEIFMPPVLPKPPLEVRNVTSDTATLEWSKNWQEISPRDITHPMFNKWSSVVYVKNGLIEFEKSQGAREFKLYSEEDIEILKSNLAAGEIDKFIVRNVTIGHDTQYESYILPYAEVEKYITEKGKNVISYDLEDYIKDMSSLEEFEEMWKEITPVEDLRDLTRIKFYNTYENLESNKSYFIMLRSYRYLTDGTKVYSTMPTSLIATTTLVAEPVNPTPQVPTVMVESVSDISATIKWKLNTLLDYEVRYSKGEDVEQAEAIKLNEEEILELHKAEIDGQFYKLKIYDLFPKTQYNIWVKSLQKVGDEESVWSNPIAVETSDILPMPLTPPGGIGIASIEKALGEDFITIEWSRSQEDIDLEFYQGVKVKKEIGYILEIADNIKFLDAKSVESTSGNGSNDFSVLSKTMVKSLGLKSGVRYYVRVKTFVTVKGEGQDEFLRKESPFSIVKIIRTLHADEYNEGGSNLDIPLLEKTETLYEGDRVIINVLNDERVITDIIKNNKFDYIIDFREEENKYDEYQSNIPMNVLQTLYQRDMNILIETDEVTLNIPANAFYNRDFVNLSRTGGVDSLSIIIEDGQSDYISGITRVKDITAKFKNRNGVFETTYLEEFIDVKIDIINYSLIGPGNTEAQVYNENKGRWEKAKDQYLINRYIVFKTGKTGRYGVKY